VRVKARFFFQPGDLRRQASDLGVEFFELLLMRGMIDLGFALPLEERGQTVKCSRFPGADLVGMDVVVRSDLGERLLFLERLSDDLGLKAGEWRFLMVSSV